MSERIAVIGLGYVGLPLAVALAKAWPDVIGFDIDTKRVTELTTGRDRTGEIDASALAGSRLIFSSDPAHLADRTAFIVAVPTPVDDNHRPDLTAVLAACKTIGPALSRGALIVFESTVYPGLTEEICGPALAAASGLTQGRDFHLGYSPERINPGDKAHAIERVVKVVAGENATVLDRVAAIYGPAIPAGLHCAPSIAVAEAAKVIENVQRDVNIALMNELSTVFDRLGLRTADVLAAARTKWNFLNFTPGLVGGHCIGVDPYYLTAKAETVGHHPQLILAGRRINDAMGAFVAQKTLKLLGRAGVALPAARVAILGLTFKENVPDIRNTRVPDIVAELASFGVQAQVHDPLVDTEEAQQLYGINPVPFDALTSADAVVLATPHRVFTDTGRAAILALAASARVFIDVKSAFAPSDLPPTVAYWSL